jgi:hypothetical protein
MLKTLGCLLLLGVMLQAFEPTLDNRALDQAIDIGRSRIVVDRTAFHRPYRLDVGRAPVDWIDVVTPFRRVALESELRERNGGHLFGQREALEALGPMPQRVDVVVEMTFHPLNTFIGVPSYDVSLAAAAAGTDSTARAGRSGSTVIGADHIERVPRFGTRVNTNALPYPYQGGAGVPRGGETLTGGVIVAQFDGRALVANGVYDIVVSEGAKELARARLDLRGVR